MYKIEENAEHDICMYKALKFKHLHVQGSQMIKGEENEQQEQQERQQRTESNM